MYRLQARIAQPAYDSRQYFDIVVQVSHPPCVTTPQSAPKVTWSINDPRWQDLLAAHATQDNPLRIDEITGWQSVKFSNEGNGDDIPDAPASPQVTNDDPQPTPPAPHPDPLPYYRIKSYAGT